MNTRSPAPNRAHAPAPAHRPDIQGLRAIAVILVVAYHLRPSFVPGGFVGVDVFFVVSGYLIVGSLAKEAISSGSISLTSFYARRVRRLMPASTLVILLTLAAGLVILPATQWRALGVDAVASALQVQNWMLAFGPNEYAQATAATSPYQHFWSLAVEEQFYAVIPLVVLLTATVAMRRGVRTDRAITVMTAGILLLSFAWSVVYSSLNHQAAYFATTTRMWELALGAIVALVGARLALPYRWALGVGVLGVAAIVVSALVLSTATVFPGWIALVPTSGAVALLLAGQTARPTPVTRALGWRPATYIGDISYSLYLWHWPLIVFAMAIFGTDRLPWPVVGTILVLSFGMAALSERFVERPFRSMRPKAQTSVFRYRTLLAGAVGVALTVGIAALPVTYIDNRIASSANAPLTSHPGAMALRGAVVAAAAVAPDPLVAQSDVSLANRDGCIVADITIAGTSDGICQYGPADADRRFVLVGDSHAAVLSTPLAQLAAEKRFRLTVLVRNGCPFNVIPMAGGFDDCAEQNKRSLALILEEAPDAVIVANMSAAGYEKALGWGWASADAATSGFVDTLRPMVDAGIRVYAVHDTPYPPFAPPECVERHGDSDLCAFERPRQDTASDPLMKAASEVPGVGLIDLTDGICRPEQCRSVEGNVLVYRDNHLSDRYARTLAPWLSDALGL